MSNQEKPKATNWVDEMLGQNLKQIRESKGITQEVIVQKMKEKGFEFFQSTIYNIEKGNRRVSLGEAVALGKCLEVDIEEFTKPKLSDDLALVGALRYGAKLELDAIERALNALNDIRLSASAIKLNLANLQEPEKKYPFGVVPSTPQEIYGPLGEVEVKPALELLDAIHKNTRDIAKFLNV